MSASRRAVRWCIRLSRLLDRRAGSVSGGREGPSRVSEVLLPPAAHIGVRAGPPWLREGDRRAEATNGSRGAG